jgi:hypothetical protein
MRVGLRFRYARMTVDQSERSSSRVWIVAEGVAGFLLIWLALTVWRQEVLYLPPYEDQALGYWSEADYLREHHFDYYTFLFIEPNFVDETPGRRAYAISILAPIMAVMQIFIPDTRTLLLVSHLVFFGMTALMGAMLATWLTPRTGRLAAWLTAIALMTSPHFIVQSEILGMDVPVATAMLASAMALSRDRLGWGIGLSLLAFAFKATGMVMTMAVITYIVVLMLFDSRKEDEGRPRYRWALVLAIGAFSLELLLEAIFDTSIPMLVGLQWFPVLRPRMAMITAPDVVALVGLVSLGAVASMILFWANRAKEKGTAWGGWLTDRRDWLIAWIVVAGFVAGVFVHVYVPRYVVPATPLLFWLVGWCVCRRQWVRPVGIVALAGLACFNVINAKGEFFPPIDAASKEFLSHWPGFDVRSCAFTERSREYLSDHLSNLALCRRLEVEFADRPIVTAEPFYSFLTVPATGYVTKSLDVRRVHSAGQTIGMLTELRAEYRAFDPTTEPILIHRRSTRSLLPRPLPQDVLIYRDSLDPPTEAYRWRSIDEMPSDPRSLMIWYIAATRRDDQLELSRIDLFMRTGRVEFARRELSAWKAKMPGFGLIDEIARKVERTAAGEGEWDKIKYSWDQGEKIDRHQ